MYSYSKHKNVFGLGNSNNKNSLGPYGVVITELDSCVVP